MGISDRAEGRKWLPRIVLAGTIALLVAIAVTYLARGYAAVPLLALANVALLLTVGRLLRNREDGRDIERNEAASESSEEKEPISDLEGAESRHGAFVDNSLHPVVIFQDFRIKFANRLFHSFTGFTPEEVKSENFDVFSFVHEDDKARAISYIEKLLNGERILGPVELRYCKKSGGIITCLTFSSVITFNGSPAIETVAIDITRMKEAERDLAKTKERLQHILDDAPVMIFSFDREGNVVYVNEETLRVTGYETDELLGKSFAPFLHPDDLPVALENFKTGLRGDERSRHNMRIRCANGDLKEISIDTRILQEDDDFAGMLVIARDVTEKARMQEQLARDKEFIDGLIENANAMIGVTDENGKFIIFNKRFEEVTGFTKKEALGNHAFALYVPEESRGLVSSKVREGTDIHHIEIPIVSKEGKPLVATWSGARVKLPSGKKGVVVVGQDVTAEKRIQEELVQSKKLASVGKLVSGVAHELNNPLTIVMGYSQMMSVEQEIPEKSRIMSQKIFDAASRSKRIVENLLAFARKKKPEKYKIDTNELVEDMLALREHNFKVNNIEIVRNYDKSLPATLGDGQQLQQVFLNLINNAFDAMYSANRGGTLEVKTYRNDRNIIVELIDDGPGVPESLQEKIFDPFFTTKEVGEGTGLGISLSYGIVKEHGGRIYLDKGQRNGAKFVIELPLIESAALSPAGQKL